MGRKKKLGKKQKDTVKDMKKTRKQDTIRLRKKSEQLLKDAEIDREKILEIKQMRQKQLTELEIQLIKNTGAIEILKILNDEK